MKQDKPVPYPTRVYTPNLAQNLAKAYTYGEHSPLTLLFMDGGAHINFLV